QPDTIHVLIAANLVILLETHLDKGGMLRGVRGINRRKSGSDADVRHDHAEFVRRYNLPNRIFNPLNILLRQLNPRSRRGFQIDDKLPGVRAGKVSYPEQ